MRTLDPDVIAPVWTAIHALIPAPVDHHPLGCQRPRLPDLDCIQVLLVRLVTGGWRWFGNPQGRSHPATMVNPPETKRSTSFLVDRIIRNGANLS